jgi:CubicO group peptidase (beta-lactamase class C family)
LPDLAEQRLFGPLGMGGTLFWAGPQAAPPGGVPLSDQYPAPLSLGDGGAWTTADDLLRWTHAMNADVLGVADLVQAPGRLNDGTTVDYGWATGIGSEAGRRVYRHAGSWPGIQLLLTRLPECDAAAVVIAVAEEDETGRYRALADTLQSALAAGQYPDDARTDGA